MKNLIHLEAKLFESKLGKGYFGIYLNQKTFIDIPSKSVVYIKTGKNKSEIWIDLDEKENSEIIKKAMAAFKKAKNYKIDWGFGHDHEDGVIPIIPRRPPSGEELALFRNSINHQGTGEVTAFTESTVN